MKNYNEYFDTCVFGFKSENNIIEEKELGICSSIASVITPESSVTALRGMQACPYTNTALDFDVRIDGEKIKSKSWRWLPSAILRKGESKYLELETLTAVIADGRGAVLKITMRNKSAKRLTVPLSALYRGKTVRQELWTFDIPQSAKASLSEYFDNGRIIGNSDGKFALMLTTSVADIRMFKSAFIWEGMIEIPSKGEETVYYSIHIGPEAECKREAEAAIDNYESLISASFDYLAGEVKRIYQNLPRLSSDNPELDALYYRSLVTYILCRWDNPELCVSPYFSTGSINGSCMCSYLWDWCGGLMLHPIYDAAANKKQLCAFLRNDLTSSYALNPVTAGPVGPWYMVNQEKIILMVYYHVLFTGDKDFLFEIINGKTVIEHMCEQAFVCDDLTKDIQLYDYGVGKYAPNGIRLLRGEGNEHLELRGEHPYNGVMPDLNARRFMNYMRVYELTCVAGKPNELLKSRAAMLKEKLKSLWNDEKKWYDFISDGKSDTRYTVQMFKFLSSDVIGAREREGLISHLNDREFLSKFGLHSMSKQDVAYDQDDVDNGGGGICTHFTMQICSQLYATGYDAIATDILNRVLWWGTCLPYMGDSCLANLKMNREDTPLQGDISSVSAAQMIFYYIFGITADFNGNITVSPAKVRPAENMKIENARLCGKQFSINIFGDSFAVEIGEQKYCAKIGEKIII